MIAHATVATESDKSNNHYEVIKGSLDVLSRSTSSFAVRNEEMRALYTLTPFTEYRIKCYKPWHQRTLDVVVNNTDLIRNFVGFQPHVASINLCKGVRFLSDDTSSIQQKPCNSYESGAGLYNHPFFITYQEHTHIHDVNRMECDDYVEYSGFRSVGEWWYYVR